MRRLGKREAGFVTGDRDIAKRSEGAAEADGAALDNADNRRFGVAERTVEIENRFGAVAHGIGFRRGAGLRLSHRFSSETKIITRAFEQNQPRGLPRLVEHLRDLCPDRVGLAVAGFRPVQCDRCDIAVLLQ